jgi:two-component system response regulator HydG
MATILCVDDEAAVGVVLEHTLAKLGHTPLLAGNVPEAVAAVGRGDIDLIIADYVMPGSTGLDLLQLLAEQGHRIPVIIMTGYSSIESAVTSIKSGAIDYLTKPVRPETLEIAVNQALEVIRLRRENESFRSEIRQLRGSRALIGESPAFRRVMETIAAVAPTRATVLLEGESGTGKELFARAIHDLSPRAEGPFVTVNCAALPEGLVESALFGHERGAFTGATARAAGAFERAHGGTLLLDEISEMRLDLQSKLLRAIQEQEFERVGGSQSIRVDVRLIATTNRELKAEVDAGRFRSDLYYRLNVMPIRTPPLRERVQDIPRLAHHFLQRAVATLGTQAVQIAPDAMLLLQRQTWPGNVRELANRIERAAILGRGDTILASAFTDDSVAVVVEEPAAEAGGTGAGALPPGALPPQDAPVFDLDELERRAIERALAATGGNRTRAARLLGISERTLRNRLNQPKTTPEN